MNTLKKINGVVQDYTIVLSSRSKKHLGQLTGLSNINYNHNLNSADEMSFSLNKYKMLDINNNTGLLSNDIYIKMKQDLWEQVVDLKLIWVKELDEYFEIKVKTTDSKDVTKIITATSLCEAELSQILLDNVEINTEADISRDDYEVTTFFNENNHNASLLHRVFEKAPQYTIKYVDESLKNLQRSFSITDNYIYNYLIGECSEQFNCLFQFDSSDRSVSVYDLYTTCEDCGYRDDYYDICPKCGSKHLRYFGKDTTIYVDKTNLTDSISLESNVDNIKNCFKLVAGDDLMSATVRMLNQNGSDYIYYFSESQRKDMPEELVERLDSYDKLYKSYTGEYQELVSDIYDLTDQILYLESGKMPTIENAEVTASTEVKKLTAENLSPLGLSSVTESTSLATVNSALKNYAKVYVKTGYVKLEINDGATFEYTGLNNEDGWTYGTWTGSFKVTNYSDEDDVINSETLTITVYDNYQDFVEQKILKSMSEDDKYGSVFDVLGIEDIDEFKDALSLYCKNRLVSFYDAIQGALDVLIQMDQASEGADLYEALYLPYYEKLQACQEALDNIQGEIDSVQNDLDEAENRRHEIQEELDFKKYLGEYFGIFCSYKREQKYSNSNYISDGLSNAELIKNANDFIEVATKELYKSGEKQWTLSSTLFNLLALPEFEPIIDYFELGNWIRLRVDGELFRLRLLSCSVNFDSIESLSVEFSNVSKIKDIRYEAQQVIQSAKVMSTSYSYVSKQAEKGSVAQSSIENWKQDGLDSGYIQIKNNNNEEVIYDKHGILCRAFDDITGTYDPKQSKLTHNTFAFTDNGWKSVKQIIGNHSYKAYNPETNQVESYEGYGMTADFLSSSYISGKTIVGGEIYSDNYKKTDNGIDGTYMNLTDGIITGGKIYSSNYDDSKDTPSGTYINLIEGKIIGGEIESNNYSDESGNKDGTYINLLDGSFSFGGGGLTYSKEDGLKISSTAIEESLNDVNIIAENLQVKAQNINTDNGKITLSQIEDINFDDIKGQAIDSQIKELSASKISGTISSSQIDDTLSNKTITNGSFSGDLTISSIKTSDNGTEYSGITGEYTIGENVFKFVNGILVSVT